MPISQDRLIALIEVADELRDARDRLAATAQEELDAALTEFYASDGNEIPLAGEILAHLQAVVALISSSPISLRAGEILSREREHFRLTRTANIRQRNLIARKRNREIEFSRFEPEEASETAELPLETSAPSPVLESDDEPL